MRRMTICLDLTNAEMEALKFESEHENMTAQELVQMIIKQNIPSLLDVIETGDEGRRQELMRALLSDGHVPMGDG